MFFGGGKVYDGTPNRRKTSTLKTFCVVQINESEKACACICLHIFDCASKTVICALFTHLNYDLHTSIHPRDPEYFSSSSGVNSTALAALPAAGYTISNLLRDSSR